MFTKIDRIKRLGVFADYAWDASLPAFSRYNIIYGENGTGKTTLSRLFTSFGSGIHSEYPDLEYRLSSLSGEVANGIPNNKKIRVFNADFVNANIGQLEDSLKPILVIGEENVELVAQLRAGEAEYNARQSAASQKEAELAKLVSERGKLFTQIAKVISEASSGSTVRNYRKPQAEVAYRKLANTTQLSEGVLAQHRTTLTQEIRDVLSVPNFRIALTDEEFQRKLAEVLRRVEEVCARSAVSDAIERLRSKPDVAAWVEKGIALHQKPPGSECEFCGHAITEHRWDELSRHFSEDDQRLKNDLEELLTEIERISDASQEIVASLPHPKMLYSDLSEEYDLWVQRAQSELSSFQTKLGYVVELLNDKLTRRTESVLVGVSAPAEKFIEALDSARVVIGRHNDKTLGFGNAKAKAIGEIERHYLASIAAEVDETDRSIGQTSGELETLRNGDAASGLVSMSALEISLREKRSAISNAHKAADELTKLLQSFLGRKDLDFRSVEEGYRLYRNGRIARRLSEGERMAIAFIYFIVQLRDQDFEIRDGVVVIDDPVSSLDSGSLYQAFAFLKTAVQDAKQVFLLTHNHSFLGLALNWLSGTSALKRQKQTYMLVCSNLPEGRTTRLTKLDALLEDNPTEYHYLFKVVASFQGDGTIASCYHMPNVCRKVLEAFLDFHQPARGSLFAKLNRVRFDDTKKVALYKFTNDLSHRTGGGFEPGLVQEAQKNARYLLEMIEAVDPGHYVGMCEAAGINVPAA